MREGTYGGESVQAGGEEGRLLGLQLGAGTVGAKCIGNVCNEGCSLCGAVGAYVTHGGTKPEGQVVGVLVIREKGDSWRRRGGGVLDIEGTLVIGERRG